MSNPLNDNPGVIQLNIPVNPNMAPGQQYNQEELLQLLMSNPQMQTLLQQRPGITAQMLTDPAFINGFAQQMSQVMNGEYNDGEDYYDDYDNNMLNLDVTPEQKKEIQDMVTEGFGSFEDVVQYYVAFGYDKNATVNALLDNKFNDDY